MSVITELQFSPDQFVLARTMGAVPETVFELERVVPIERGMMPYLWVSDDGPTFREAIADDPTVDAFTQVDDFNGGGLFHVDWGEVGETFVNGLHNGDETIIQAVGQDDEWFCKIRFENRESISSFQNYCEDRDISFTLRRLYDSQAPKFDQYDMTTRQRDAIVVALEMGYFDVPRQCELSEVAAELDLSPNAVSERIRRGEANLFRSALTIDRPPHHIHSE